ncbi:retrotransposon protein, putative, ty1-copia subclass [Tanacetum coccineum]
MIAWGRQICDVILHALLIDYEKGLKEKVHPTPQVILTTKRVGINKSNRKETMQKKRKGKAVKNMQIEKVRLGFFLSLALYGLALYWQDSHANAQREGRYGYVYLLKHKHEVFETFKVFKAEVELQLGKKIKALRSDRGGEYLSQEFKDYLSENGIVQNLTSPYTPQQNGVSERRNRTLLDMVRSMFNLTTLPLSFWDYALESAVRILNMVPTKKVDKTPYEIWHGKAPNLSYLKVWGCEAYVKRDSADKLQQRSVKCIFVGYPKETMGYYFYFPPENKVIVARYGDFLERDLISQEFSGRDYDLEDDHMDTLPSENTSEIPVEPESLGSPSELIPVRRSERTKRAPNRLCLNMEVEDDEVGDLGEPANYKTAMLDPDKVIWQGAMDEEMKSMKVNKVWIVIDRPPNAKVVRSKWIFKKKTDMDGKVHTYKARLVAKGCTQTYGIDYEETFSPVADIRAIRILIAIAAYYDYEIWQMDVKTAFLNGRLDKDIYMEQPEGYVDPNYPNGVCKLQRAIYGLKQASRQWNKRFDEEIKKFGFIQNRDEPCVYRKASGSDIVFLILYVDDILIMGNNIPRLKEVKDYLGKCFSVKDLGEAAYILGIKIYRDRSLRLIGLNQNEEKAYMKKVPYASAVGSIMYVADSLWQQGQYVAFASTTLIERSQLSENNHEHISQIDRSDTEQPDEETENMSDKLSGLESLSVSPPEHRPDISVNDSEDDQSQKRMRGLKDIGNGGELKPSVKRRRSQVAYGHDCVKKKNRRCQLTNVLKRTETVMKPDTREKYRNLNGVPGVEYNDVKQSLSNSSGNSSGRLFDVPYIGCEPNQTAGPSIKERAILFLEAQDHVKKGPLLFKKGHNLGSDNPFQAQDQPF